MGFRPMADLFCPLHSHSFLVALFILLLPCAIAMPLPSPLNHLALAPRTSPIINTNAGNGIIEVFDPTSHQPIPQAPASDGGGTGLTSSSPAILWVVVCLLVGLPLAVAGVRGWRLTTGAALGLALGVCAWAAFINTVSAPGISDLPLTLIIFTFIGLGFILGTFSFMRIAGIAALGVVGGLAVGVRIAIIKRDLLVSSSFTTNWLIAALFGLLGGGLVAWKQRVGILLCSAAAGTFLIGVGFDLIINKQDGLSRGLRFLFDRNTSHLADMLSNPYRPPISSQAIVAASLGASPFLAYLQHRFFPQPFNRNRPESFILKDDDIPSVEKSDGEGGAVLAKRLVSRFSL